MKPVAEFKFSCPVCHQHILAGAESAGKEIECPTCFQHILVPSESSNAATRLILRGRQAAKPQTRMIPTVVERVMPVETSSFKIMSVIAIAVALIAIGLSSLAKYHDHMHTGTATGNMINAAAR